MTWGFYNENNLDKLLEYERKLEEFMQENPLRSGVCQYHCNMAGGRPSFRLSDLNAPSRLAVRLFQNIHDQAKRSLQIRQAQGHRKHAVRIGPSYHVPI